MKTRLRRWDGRGDASKNSIKDLTIGFGTEYTPCGALQANAVYAVFIANGALTCISAFVSMRLEADESVRKDTPCGGGCFRREARSFAMAG